MAIPENEGQVKDQFRRVKRLIDKVTNGPKPKTEEEQLHQQKRIKRIFEKSGLLKKE